MDTKEHEEVREPTDLGRERVAYYRSRGYLNEEGTIRRDVTDFNAIIGCTHIHDDYDDDEYPNQSTIAWLHAMRDLQWCCGVDGMWNADGSPFSGMPTEEFARFWDDVTARRRAAFIRMIELELEHPMHDGAFDLTDLHDIIKRRTQRSARREAED